MVSDFAKLLTESTRRTQTPAVCQDPSPSQFHVYVRAAGETPVPARWVLTSTSAGREGVQVISADLTLRDLSVSMMRIIWVMVVRGW